MNEFIIKLVFSFIIGSVWIVLLSIFSERFGSKIGGAIAGIPATMVVSLLFIALTQDAAQAVQSTTVIPLMLGVNALLVLIFVLLLRFGFLISFFSSILFWFIISFIFKIINFDNFIFSVIGYLLCVGITYYMLEHKLHIKSVAGKKIRYTSFQIFGRCLIAGITIVSSVVLANISGPLLGGIFASFPAMTIALILMLHADHDDNTTVALLKNFIIVGTLNVVIFTLSIRYTYLVLGIAYGTILSILLSILSAYFLYYSVNKKMS